MISFLKRAEPVTLVRSPMLTKEVEEVVVIGSFLLAPSPLRGEGWGEG
jgi:hypothetical protein